MNTEDHARPDYGTEAQTYIIDGSGVYVTRNTDTYHHGRRWVKDNKAYNNGINGLVVHKTDRAHVVGNVIWDNGKVRNVLNIISIISYPYRYQRPLLSYDSPTPVSYTHLTLPTILLV